MKICMKKRAIGLFVVLGIFLLINNIDFSVAQQNTVCCERTNNGAFCQDVPAEECADDSRQLPTSCEATSFCRAGTCYDSSEGTCLDNTPQIVCNENGGIWSLESPAQCNLGCCVLGDQAAFVTLVRCKKLSSFLGLETNYDVNIESELACVQSVQAQDKGACVYEYEFERTCKFTTRAECEGSTRASNGTSANGEFYADKLCYAEELGTNCGPSTQTTCVDGKDEVYFLDTCGNVANIYDASKTKDVKYWTDVVDKAASCGPNSGNMENKNCGNCNYLLGSFCRAEDAAGAKANYGDYICANLNCEDESGNERLHGESWCVNDDKTSNDGVNKVGERYFRQICMNGEIVTEACSDFRNEECIEGSIKTDQGEFSQAACRVNRWQDCLVQDSQDKCENSDVRDCFWRDGIELGNSSDGGTCLPENPPGLNFWEEESLAYCSQANTQCVVKFEKGLFEGEECVDNCDCLTPEWERQQAEVCQSIGDCGPKLNWINIQGRKTTNLTIKS